MNSENRLRGQRCGCNAALMAAVACALAAAIALAGAAVSPQAAFAADSASVSYAAGSVALEPAKAKKVENYTYTVKPLIAPFNQYIYVKTANPKPTSFRLVDKSSKYLTKSSEASAGTFALSAVKYLDVKYEKAKTFRVKGGYIFYDRYAGSDGGNLVLQKKNSQGEYVDTKVKVKCSKMKTDVDYLIDTYTKDKKTFFDKMDAVDSSMFKLAIYPCSVYDKSKPNKAYPYPLLAASIYPELSLNDHYHMYEVAEGGSLMLNAYPFILDSYSMPNLLYTVAKKLNSKCTGKLEPYAHWLVNITLNGKTRTYGGACGSNNSPIYSNRLKKTMKFNAASDDMALKGSLAKWGKQIKAYKTQAVTDEAKYRDLIAGDTFHKKLKGGTWIRVGYEGWFGVHKGFFAYYADTVSGLTLMSDAWVEGRYIDDHEVTAVGEKFADHSNADIVKRNMKFTDRDGVSHQCDVVYYYDSGTDTWRATDSYNGGSWYSNSGDELPSEFVMTRAQAKAYVGSANISRPPLSGLVYDGDAYPGTKFKTVFVTGLKVPAKVTTYVGSSTKLNPKVAPSNATYDGVTWTSSNEKVATVSDGYVYGQKAGTATLTARTTDGGYTAKCKVTVKKPTSLEKASIKLSKKKYTYDGKAKKPKVTVKLGGKTLKKGVDYTVEYGGNVNADFGSYVSVRGKNAYSETKYAYFNIKPAKNPMTVKPAKKKITASAKAIAKKTVKIKRSKAFAVKRVKGALSFAKLSGNKNIKVTSKGSVLLKKGLEKGTYKVRVKVRADGYVKVVEKGSWGTSEYSNQNYKTKTKKVTLTIKVK